MSNPQSKTSGITNAARCRSTSAIALRRLAILRMLSSFGRLGAPSKRNSEALHDVRCFPVQPSAACVVIAWHGPFVSPVRLNAIGRPDWRNRNCFSEPGTAERRRKRRRLALPSTLQISPAAANFLFGEQVSDLFRRHQPCVRRVARALHRSGWSVREWNRPNWPGWLRED